jgi:NADPH:quinone reductase-like Zn-dependent oxidoreductase
VAQSSGDVVAQLGDVVAQLVDVVAQKGRWWLSRGCGGSVGDVVAQLAKATG